MTLITYVVTKEYVVLASDRRQTTFVGGMPTAFEDSALKTFFLRGQLLMGYTGVARLDGEPMEKWLADHLNGVVPNDVPQALADGMQEYYRRHREVQGMPHHFRLAGFAYTPDRDPATWPIGYEVGNSRWAERNGRVRAVDVADQFTWTQNRLGNRVHAVGAVGSPYSLKSLRVLEGMVRTAIRIDPLNPALVFRPIVEFMRKTAMSSAGMVGETILIASVPRRAVPVTDFGWSLPVTPDGLAAARNTPFAMMVNEGASDPAVYLPAIINPDIQIIEMTITSDSSDS